METTSSNETKMAEITIDDFAKIDLQVGEIMSAERIPNADKLLHLKVKVKDEIRDIASGIAEHFAPEELIGLQVMVVANLLPRKMRGIESRGMLLLTQDENGKLVFMTPAKKVTPGSEIR